jgi:DNA-binding XRE family transcriptional regulator
MSEGVAAEIGAVIRSARLAVGWTQAELGRRCGYAASTISRMERGKQSSVLDIEVLHRISVTLEIPPHRLGLATQQHADVETAGRDVKVVTIRSGGGWVDRRSLLRATLGLPLAAALPGGPPTEPVGDLTDSLVNRLLWYPAPSSDVVPSAAAAHQLLDRVQASFNAANYRELARWLPRAIDSGQSCVAADESPESLKILARIYLTASSTALKLGRLDLAWIGADRAVLAAGRSGDVLAQAQVARELAILSRKAGRLGQTIRVAVDAADRLESAGLSQPERLAQHGLLLSTAAYAAAQSGDRGYSHDLLSDAAADAERLSNMPHGSPAFGIGALMTFQVSASWALGDLGTAISHARSVPLSALPSVERRERLWIDVARVWQRWDKPVECFKSLLAAERVAPQAVRVRPVVHSVTTWLLSAPTTVGLSGLREFATRIAGT